MTTEPIPGLSAKEAAVILDVPEVRRPARQ